MYRIAAVLCSMCITITSIPMVAIPFPYLPYTAPEMGQVLDIINNAYGVVAPAIEDKVKKVEAYATLYRAVLGTTFDTFWQGIQEVTDKAKTSRTITLTPSMQSNIRKGLKRMVSQGMSYETGETITTLEQARAWVLNNTPITNLPLENMQEAATFNQAQEPYRVIVFTQPDPYTGQGVIAASIIIVSSTQTVNIVNLGSTSSPMYRVSWQNTGKSQWATIECNINSDTSRLSYINNSNAYISASGANMIELAEIGEAHVNIEAQDATIQASIEAETATVLTEYAELTNSKTVDETKPVRIQLPATDVIPATTIADLPGVQEELNVMPVSATEDVEAKLQQIQEQAAATTGDATDYAMDLTEFFPFCIPFDIFRILQAFQAEPEAPKVSYTIPNPFAEQDETGEDDTDGFTLEVDLSRFDAVAAIARKLETILFVIGLAVVTRKVFLRG